MDFTLDLASKAGEIYYTSPVGSSLYLSDRLTVTPNYIVFPAEGGNITFNRKDSTFTRNRLEGVCEVVEREESKRVF